MKKKNDCAQKSMITAVIESKVEEKVKEVVRATMQKEITKETLPSFFEDLHNLLWSQAGLNPERALAHMTFFFAYRLIEPQADLLNLPQECRWSYLASHKNENDTYVTMNKGYLAFQKNKITKPFFKKPEIDKAGIIYEIIQQISRISLTILQETDTLGDIFEYMLGRGMSTMSDDGQYFTNRSICKLAFKLAYDIKKTLRRADGSLCTFADWFCGTGGFPAEFVKGVKEHDSLVNWKRDAGSIFCQDMNLSSVTTTLLNMLILTGIPFSGNTIRGSNSFTDAITMGVGAPFPGMSVDYCFMNPPYGGDKSKGKDYKFAYSKTVKGDDGGKSKKFFVNQEIQSVGIEDDDKVSAGVQLGMATLSENGGVCCIVLPQGFFFGATKKCVELRKKIAEDYKIYYVVDIASGSFLNTGTKTSMIVFQKGVGATETLSFIGLDEKVLVEATLEDLRKKNYSLNYKQYLSQSAVEVDGFEMVKLGDLITKIKGGKTNSTEISHDGEYDFYGCTANVPTGKHNTYDFEGEEYLLFAKSGGNAKKPIGMNLGIGKFHYVCGKSAGNIAIYQYKIRDTSRASYRYLFYILRTKLSEIQMLADYTTGNGNINIENMYSLIQIPLPSLKRQQEIVEQIDFYTQLAHTEEQSLKLLEKVVMGLVMEMGHGKERVKLGEVCDWQMGKRIVKDQVESGSVPVYGGGGITFYTNSSNRSGINCKISREGMSEANCVIMIHGDYHQNSQGMTVVSKDVTKTINPYIWYWLVINKDKVYECGHGTAQKAISMVMLNDLQIPLPTLAEQQMLQSDFDEIRHKHAKIAEYKAKAQEAIQRLIPGATQEMQKPTPMTESHSSTCHVEEDGSGCTCRIRMDDEKEDMPAVAAVTPKKMRKPTVAK
jgi:type I restriction-modification system DNA methylase subunit/restriction endonuclease S subunit